MAVKNLSRTKLREIQDAWDSGALKPQSNDRHKFNRKVWVKNNTGMRLNYGDHVKLEGFSVVKSANISKRSAMTNGLVFKGTFGNEDTPSEMIASVITPAKAGRLFQAEIPLEYAFIKNKTVDGETYYPTVGEYASASNEADETTGVYRILATSLPGVDGEDLGKFCAIARIAGTAPSEEEGGGGIEAVTKTIFGTQVLVTSGALSFLTTSTVVYAPRS